MKMNTDLHQDMGWSPHDRDAQCLLPSDFRLQNEVYEKIQKEELQEALIDLLCGKERNIKERVLTLMK